MKKRFVTLFPPACNVHLLKDVGMIPFCMYRDYGYDATLVCFPNEENYPALEKETKGLKINFLKQDKEYTFGRISLKVLNYLEEHAKEIDILNLYHNTTETLVYGLFYKMFNPKGILYLKLDINIERFDAQKTQWIHPLRMLGYRGYFKYIADLVSAELPSSKQYLLQHIPSLQDKLLLITNGTDDKAIRESGISVLPAREKENLIIAVGRIGAREKNHEMLLQAVAQAGLKDWQVALIGPVEEPFRIWTEEFISRHPHLKGKITLTGNISDRRELYKWYNRAKVFCLTSKYESFGLVFTEALYFGNYIVTTPVMSSDYITDSARLGSVVHTEKELAETLGRITDGTMDIAPFYDAVVEYSEKFRWTTILGELDEAIRMRRFVKGQIRNEYYG